MKQVLLLEQPPVAQANQVDRASTLQFEYDSRERAHHWMRLIVGILGVALPPLLVFGWMRLDETDGPVQGSLSAYYHTGMRDFFVGTLVVIGFLLITYKIAEKTPENRWSQIGGVAAIGVALIPTGIPASLKETATLTPLQKHINALGFPWDFERPASEEFHYFFTIILLVTLFILCLGYMSQERRKGAGGWSSFHGAMAFVMILAGIYVVLAPMLNLFEDHRILIGEWAVVWAFGLSWLLKGWHVEVLFGKTSSRSRAGAEESAVDTSRVRTADA